MRAAIASVHYGDMLAVTLPAWKALLPAGVLTVVTSDDDRESQTVAMDHGVSVTVTDAWTREDETHWYGKGTLPTTFNKALALDEALGLVGVRPRPMVGEPIAAIDVDGYPQGKCPNLLPLKDGFLYSVERHHCPTQAMFADVLSGKIKRQDVRRMKNSNNRPVGYFQLFRYRPGLRFGSYPTAQKYDTHFCSKFIDPDGGRRHAYLDSFWIWHLGPQDDRNWAGRVLPRWDGVPA